MLVLGVVVLVAVFMLGRRAFLNSPAVDNQDVVGVVDTTDGTNIDPSMIERWVPPDNPRDPFAPLVFDATTTTTVP